MLHVKRAYHYRAAELARLEVGELSLSTDYDALSGAVVCGWGEISIGRSRSPMSHFGPGIPAVHSRR